LSLYYAYLLRCADGSLYAGYTGCLHRRIRTHNKGKGAKYTRSRLPVALAYAQCFTSKSEAMRREAAIKRLDHARREALLRGAQL